MVGDRLHWRFRTLVGALDHRHWDVFEIPEDLSTLSPGPLTLTFHYDRDGTIDRVIAPFEPQVAGIVFERCVAAPRAADTGA